MNHAARSCLLSFAATLVLGLSGCGFKQAKLDAEAMLNQHFQAEALGATNAVLADYGSAFFQKTTANEWSRDLGKVTEKLGTYQSHTVTGWRVFKNTSTSGSGTTVSFECDVRYSKHAATETLLLFKGTSDPGYKIIGHHISSPAMLGD